MNREIYEKEVLRFALQILARHEESREAGLTECERVIHEIVDSQSHFGFHLEHGEDFMEPGTGVGVAYAMSLALGIFAALNAKDPTPSSPAYQFSRVLQRRASIADPDTTRDKNKQTAKS